MAITLEDLEHRLHALENETASLRELVKGFAKQTAPECAARITRESARQADLEIAINDVYQKMGIFGEAPGIERLRTMLAAHGIHPGDEVVREEIAAMRDQEQESLTEEPS